MPSVTEDRVLWTVALTVFVGLPVGALALIAYIILRTIP